MIEDQDRDFDRWLAGELARRREEIADDGFSRRVSASLSASPAPYGRRYAFAVVFYALLTGGLVYALVPWGVWVRALVELFAGIPPLTLLQLGFGMTLALTTVAWAALRFERILAP